MRLTHHHYSTAFERTCAVVAVVVADYHSAAEEGSIAELRTAVEDSMFLDKLA